MNCGNECRIKENLKNCLIHLDYLFQWLAAIENKPIKKDGIEMGSNFAKFLINPEYINFIQPACNAEKHFANEEYPECAERCRNSMGEFLKYLYTKFGWQQPIGKIKPDEPSLDQLLKYSNMKRFLKTKCTTKYTFFKKNSNDATHQPFSETDINVACQCLKDLFYLITKTLSEDNTKSFPGFAGFGGTLRFDIGLLANSSKEIIQPQLTIEVNGFEQAVPQNVLLKSVLSKNITESIINKNLLLINKTDVLGNTPLSIAVYNDDIDTVKMLLDKGADPNLYFKKEFRSSVTDEISKDSVKYSSVRNDYIEAHNCVPLIVAIKKDNVDIVKLLLDAKAKTWDSCIDDYYAVAKIPPECSTLLGCAIFYNAKKCIRFLLKNDICDVNEEIRSGVTPLLLAVENGIYVEKLLEKGAKIDFLDKYRNSVFLHAVQNMRHDYELLEKLLEKAKSILTEDKFNKLINHSGRAGCPISYMNKDEVELFLEYGADINAKNELGVSCLVDVANLNPELLPWYRSKGAQFDFKAFFYRSSYLQIKDTFRTIEYRRGFFTDVLLKVADFISAEDLNFTVPVSNIPQISPLVDAILIKNSNYILQDNIAWGEEKENKEFLIADLNISPLDDALIANNYDVVAFYLSKGIRVSELSKILLLSVHDVSEKDLSACDQVRDVLKTRNDIDFSNVLISLCKNHPKDDFDIAEEFINNGYNYYSFANYILPTASEDVQERNNIFLEHFGENSFQDVNLRLIKNAISFGADINCKDASGKTALDYAKENGIDKLLLQN